MKKLLYICSIAIFTLFIGACENSTTKERYVIMVSMDGFRWDYTSKTETPNFDYMEANGCKAESMVPSFPTKTFPNHYTLATGLYPDHHGIVGNSFRDTAMKKTYSIGNREMVENPDFYGGEPIWVTAEKQGIRTASFYWVGSEAAVKGTQPKYWKKYQHNFPFKQRVDTVLHWLNLPKKERPQLVCLYFHEPDGIGHKFGPNSKETISTIAQLDSLLGRLIKGVSQLSIASQVDIIVLSDHGMGTISNERNIKLNDHVSNDWCKDVIGYTPFYMIQPKEGKKEAIITALQNVKNIKAWAKEDVPSHLKFGKNPRIYDVVAVADSSYSITWNEDLKETDKGTHGYENTNKDMDAIFYSMGPSFKKRHKHPSFSNVEVYGIICKILGLTPAPYDGNIQNVQGMFKE